MKHKTRWVDVWFHDKTFNNSIPEIVARFIREGDARNFFNQFYPRFADQNCSITIVKGNAILHQIIFEQGGNDNGNTESPQS